MQKETGDMLSDYVEAMWKMLQQKKPHDFVIGTGKMHSVKDFLNTAFKYLWLGLEHNTYSSNIDNEALTNWSLFKDKAQKILGVDYPKQILRKV